MEKEIFKIIIKQVDNGGFIVKIGPYLFVYTDHKKLIADIAEYFNDPDGISAGWLL